MFFQYAENVAFIVDNGDNTVEVLFTSPYDWWEIYLTPGSILFDEEHSDDLRAGGYYKQVFSGIHPGQPFGGVFDFDAIKNHELIVMLVFDNGYKKIVGNIENPVKMMVKIMNSENKQVQLGFERLSDEPARLISESESGSGSGS